MPSKLTSTAAAERCFRRLADGGDPAAQWWLGTAYARGWGAEQDAARAAQWFRKAARQGFADARQKLAELEAAGKLRAVLTQNIDGLHQKAGSKEVLELHGSIYRNYCMKCGKFWPAQEIADSKGIPWCDCGGMIKPDVVLYEEALDNDVMRRAIEHIRKADMMIVAGSSLVVYPAAGLINYYKGQRLVLINRSATPFDDQADLVVHDTIGKVFGAIEVR